MKTRSEILLELREENESLKQQNAELLEALKEALPDIKDNHQFPDGKPNHVLINKIDSLINKYTQS